MLTLFAGCATSPFQRDIEQIAFSDIPRELDKATIPPYRIAQPDILLVEAVNNIRPPDSPLRAGDQLLIQAADTLPVDPMEDPALQGFKQINALYPVGSNGEVDLGPLYGTVQVAGLTLDEARQAIEKHLREQVGLTMPKLAVSMPNVAGKQVITGDHLVRPDGTISLGVYGGVRVAGLTLAEAKLAIEQHLANYIHQPEVSVDVLSYNSKTIYVVTDGGGFGEQVIRLPFTGNETVLDAIAQIQGLSEVSSKDVWVARPAPAGTECAQRLPVDWRAITQDGITATNYQLFPGDRVYIEADHWVAFDNVVAKITSPFERIFGFILLGHGVQRALEFGHLAGERGVGGLGGVGGGFF